MDRQDLTRSDGANRLPRRHAPLVPGRTDAPAVKTADATHRRFLSRWGVVGWAVLGCVGLLLFEEVLNVVALSAFPHHDTAECAGANTFCSPNGSPGLTRGAVVFLVGNLGAAATATAVLLRRRSRSSAA